MAKISLLTSLLVFWTVGLMAQAEEKGNYYNEQYQYSFEYPLSWELEENEETGTVSLFLPLKENERVYKQLQISIASWEEGSLGEFVEIAFAEEEMRKLYPDLEITNLQVDKTKEQDAYAFKMSYENNGQKTTTLCYLEKNEDRIYIIFAATPQEEETLYIEQYMEVINSLLVW